MNNYLKAISLSIGLLLLLNACKQPIKYHLIAEEIRDPKSPELSKAYIVSHHEYSESYNQQMDAFADKVADAVKHKSYQRIYLLFYKASDKIDTNALKAGKIKINKINEDPIGFYIWYEGKPVERAHMEKPKEPLPQDPDEPVVRPDTSYHSENE